MKKILIRMVAMVCSVCLLCGTLGGSTSHAALGCKHSIVQQSTVYYKVSATYRDAKCTGTYYEVLETRVHTYFGCKYCDYVICEGGRDELISSRIVTYHEWWHGFNCTAGDYYHYAPEATGLRG